MMMMMQRLTTNDRIETVMIIGGVVNGALVTVGIDQAVRTVHNIVLARLVLALHIAGVLIVDGILVLVVRRRRVVVVHIMVDDVAVVAIVVVHLMVNWGGGNVLLLVLVNGAGVLWHVVQIDGGDGRDQSANDHNLLGEQKNGSIQLDVLRLFASDELLTLDDIFRFVAVEM